MTPAEFRAIRKAAGLTQLQLTALLRLDGNVTVSRYERGTRGISGPVSLLMEMLRDGRLVP